MSRLIAVQSKPQDVLEDLQELIDEEPDRYLNERRWTLCTARDYLKDIFNILYAPDGSERITLDRLAELVTAEVEGRAVVLPCKVGDTVYTIVYCVDVLKDYDDDYVTGTGAITCPFEDSCMFEECDDSNRRFFETCVSGLWCESDGTWKVFLEHINADIGASDFGKTVFLTRPEAEALLAKEGGQKE